MTLSLGYICKKWIVGMTLIIAMVFLFLHILISDRHSSYEPQRTHPNRPIRYRLTQLDKAASNKTYSTRMLENYSLRKQGLDKLSHTSAYDHIINMKPNWQTGNLEKDETIVPLDYEIDFGPKILPNVAYFSCKEISRIKLLDELGRGTTKHAFLGNLSGSDVCVKMVTSLVHDVRICMKKQTLFSDQCTLLANYKLIKEIGLLLQLQHHSIIKMVGYCMRSDAMTNRVEDHGVVLVTEVGSKAIPYRLKEMPWPARLQAAVDISSLLYYLNTSPLGSLCMSDFKQSQFVFVNGRIKLSDLDDITSEERKCKKDRDCYILDEPANIPCEDGVCSGINEKSNLLLATVELLQPLLAEAPSSVSSATKMLIQNLNYKRLNSKQLLDEFKYIVETWAKHRDTT